MTRRRATKKDKRRRGRPPIGHELDPWLAKMRPYIEADGSIRGAALIVAKAYHHEMPRSSVHGRTLGSTIDTLRKRYPRWANEEAEREVQLALANAAAAEEEEKLRVLIALGNQLVGPFAAALQEIVNKPEILAMIKAHELMTEQLSPMLQQFSERWGGLGPPDNQAFRPPSLRSPVRT